MFSYDEHNEYCVDLMLWGTLCVICLEAHMKSIQGVMGCQSGCRHEPGSYKACPNEAVTSLKSEQVAYRHEGEMAGDTTFISSSGNRGYSRNQMFPFKGTPLRRFDTLGNGNITPP